MLSEKVDTLGHRLREHKTNFQMLMPVFVIALQLIGVDLRLIVTQDYGSSQHATTRL